MHLKINYIITKLKSFNIKKYSLTSNPTLNKTSEVLENNIWLGGSCCENGDRVSKKVLIDVSEGSAAKMQAGG